MWRSATRGTATTIGLRGSLARNACSGHREARADMIAAMTDRDETKVHDAMADETEQGDYSAATAPTQVGPGDAPSSRPGR